MTSHGGLRLANINVDNEQSVENKNVDPKNKREPKPKKKAGLSVSTGNNGSSIDTASKHYCDVQVVRPFNVPPPPVFEPPPLVGTSRRGISIFNDNCTQRSVSTQTKRHHIKKSELHQDNSVQTLPLGETDDDLEAMLCSENATMNYWKELAEQRRLALLETLEENERYCNQVEKLQKELQRLRSLEHHVDQFTQFYESNKLPTN